MDVSGISFDVGFFFSSYDDIFVFVLSLALSRFLFLTQNILFPFRSFILQIPAGADSHILIDSTSTSSTSTSNANIRTERGRRLVQAYTAVSLFLHSNIVSFVLFLRHFFI
jgi:hypothetical protein